MAASICKMSAPVRCCHRIECQHKSCRPPSGTGMAVQMGGSEMNDQQYRAMCQAVRLARSGRCSNWWTVQAQMRISGYQIADLDWTKAQRAWLDSLCAEARGTSAGCGSTSADQTRRLS